MDLLHAIEDAANKTHTENGAVTLETTGDCSWTCSQPSARCAMFPKRKSACASSAPGRKTGTSP